MPGYLHDVCSSVHSLALASPFFAGLDLESYGARFLHPAVPFAQPLDGGRAVALCRSIEETAAQLGQEALSYD